MLTIEQQKTAITYATIYLEGEISDSKKSIRMSSDEDIKKIHQGILQELEKELAIFEKLKEEL